MNVIVYGIPNCPNCRTTEKFLEKENIPFTKVDLFKDPEAMEKVKALGHTNAPVVVAGDMVWSGLNIAKIRELATKIKEG